MATVPIEIILQDAETPVDPTPTPEETNIVVPDTGAEVVGSGSTFSSSSTASIILPAILLVAALATVCTLLIHKHRKHQNSDKYSKKEKLATAASGTIAILAATVLVGNLVIPATNAATSVEPGTADLDVVDKITITATREADSNTVTATAQNISYVTANLDFGYKVTASMAKGTTTANLYLDGNTDSPYYIAPVSDGILTDNTWGYTLDEEAEEYLAIPLVDAPNTLKQGKDAVEEEPVDVYYYVKIASDMPAGTYTGELEYNLAALSPTIADLTYMQDFATLSATDKASVLRSMTEDQQYYLRDNRDNKSYRIAKLKDGKVWMVQNLDLEKEDLLPNTILDETNTDKPMVNFVLPNSQIDSGDNWRGDGSEQAYNTAHIYNPEFDRTKYYYCANYSPGPGCLEWSDEEVPKEELGNYYNWYTATAGTGTYNLVGTMAVGSLCPAGWRLPSGKSSGETEYSTLLFLYGIYSDTDGSSTIQDNLPNLFKSPLMFMRAGTYNGESINNIGTTAKLWSSVSTNNIVASHLSLDSSLASANAHSLVDKYVGVPIRCLAQ